jgi:hypothetical protein
MRSERGFEFVCVRSFIRSLSFVRSLCSYFMNELLHAPHTRRMAGMVPVSKKSSRWWQ